MDDKLSELEDRVIDNQYNDPKNMDKLYDILLDIIYEIGEIKEATLEI